MTQNNPLTSRSIAFDEVSRIRLVACPRCGGEAEVSKEDRLDAFGDLSFVYTVACTRCEEKTMPNSRMFSAIEQWELRKVCVPHEDWIPCQHCGGWLASISLIQTNQEGVPTRYFYAACMRCGKHKGGQLALRPEDLLPAMVPVEAPIPEPPPPPAYDPPFEIIGKTTRVKLEGEACISFSLGCKARPRTRLS